MDVSTRSGSSSHQHRLSAASHLYDHYHYDRHSSIPQLQPVPHHQESRLQANARKRRSTPLYACRNPPLQIPNQHNRTAQQRPHASVSAIQPLGTIPKEEQLLKKEAAMSRRTPAKTKSMGWHQDMVHLRQTALAVLDEVRQLAEDLVKAEKQTKLWQKRHHETKGRLELATAENAVLRRELERTELLLYQAEIQRSTLEKCAKTRKKDTSNNGTALYTANDRHVVPNRSLPADIVRFFKLSRGG